MVLGIDWQQLKKRKIRPESLAFRLTAAAALWIGVVLLAAAIGLTSLFRNSVEASFDSNLDVILDSLIASAEVIEGDELVMIRSLGETRFQRAYSGWYWQITALNARNSRLDQATKPYRSPSLWDSLLLSPVDGGIQFDRTNLSREDMLGPLDHKIRVLERRLILPETNQYYSFIVAGDRSQIDQEVDNFQGMLLIGLITLGVGILIALLIQVRFGLRPLEAVREALADIREGREDKLRGEFPSEIRPLAEELNSLLDYTTDMLERSRTHVGNLAHGLKTPLSVLANESRSEEGLLADIVTRETANMKDQVEHHLARARMAASARVLGATTDVLPVLERLTHALDKIFSDRALDIDMDCDETLVFRGEAQDLEELVGNLLENACKWGRSEVRIRAAQCTNTDSGGAAFFELSVEDDGPGLPENERERALKRGERLDEAVPGTGLGLSIVKDLTRLYRGKITLSASDLGGLKVTLRLPRVVVSQR
ncbi:MAG: sensor histidine kinase [Parvibaculaceae bacterium]|nr:sensor histidine kinase [Parvibaculaceae bacterium]